MRKLILSVIAILLFAPASSMSVSLPFSSTFNCADWVYPNALSCDGWGGGLSANYNEEINATANYSGGGGGKGLYHTNADGVGTSPHSGGVSLYFDTPQTHIWIRWYQYMEAGWTANWSSWKVIYLYSSTSNPGYIQLGYPGTGGARMFGGGSYDSSQTCSTCAYGYAFGNSEWVLHEVEVDIVGGAARWWINENLIIEATGITWNSLTNVDNILIPSNIKDVGNGQVVHSYFDDVAISNTGYIGPVTGGETIISNGSPSSTLSAGTTQTNMTLNTSESATCKYDTSSGVAYASMANTFSTTGGTSHSETITGLTNGSSTPYYIRCDNTTAVNTTDYTITIAVAEASPDPTPPAGNSLLLSESFEDENWPSRGWYDGVDSTGVTAGGYTGNALKWDWTTGNTKPTGFSTIRRTISYPVTAYYIKWREKYETGWQGSGTTSHPHEFYFMDEDDWIYQGPATSNSTYYHESTVDGGVIYGRFAHQDELRTNSSQGTPPLDLSSITETRSANQCNEPYTNVGAELGVCYQDSNGWYSANIWNDKAVAIPANQWVLREAYIKLNTFTAGVANYDGIIQTWINGTIDTNETGVLLAAGAYEGKGHSQFVIGPYIGAGSPTNQTLWIDDLEIWSVGDTNIICYKDTDGDTIGDGTSEIVSSCSANYHPDAWFTYLSGDCDDTNASVGLCLNTKIRSGTTTLKAGTTPIRLQ